MNNTINIEQARFNMIEQQIRTWEVLDPRVLQLVNDVHREDFVPGEFRQLAFADISIPLGHDQYTLTPKLEARILQTLNVKPTEKILEIGTGCAYLTALLARSGKNVISVDIFGDFTESARSKLAKNSIDNVTLLTGDAIHGWEQNAPYDVIVVTASVPQLSPCFQEQLEQNGRLFIVVGNSPVMDAKIITRINQQEFVYESVFETDIAPMIGCQSPASLFKF